MYSIVVDELVKRYNGTKALDCVSFKVRKGCIFALLGPNGAGKTTLTNILTTLIEPDSGYAEVAGISVKEKIKVRERIGVVFQEPALDTRLTARENLEFHAMLYGVSKKEREKRIEKALELVGLKEWQDVLVEKFSGGMKRKLEMARVFVHTPEVLFLDEPTLGLDIQTRRKIWNYIKMLRSKGITIFMTTHYIEEAENLCDMVAIIDRGKIVKIGTVDGLRRELGEDTVYIELFEPCRLEVIEKFEEVMEVNIGEDGKTIQIIASKGDELIPKLLSSLSRFGIKVKAVSVKTPGLEDVFMKLTGRKFDGV
jgi:ABC-2 type transport system ATP-binding protein